MLGAIIGDIAGSRFEWHNIKTKEFELLSNRSHFTDDTVMSIAVAMAILDAKKDVAKVGEAAVKRMQELGRKYPHAGYGGHFKEWIYSEDPQPYNSWGNGAAMRVSACGFAADSIEEAIALARAVTEVTHNHPEGLKGAEATAVAIYLARQKESIVKIQDYILKHYYPIDFKLDDIRRTYTFDVSCQGSVPQALEAFFESNSFEDAIRNAISIGGDSDTIAAITGGIAEAYYGIPEDIKKQAITYLDELLLKNLIKFENVYQSFLEEKQVQEVENMDRGQVINTLFDLLEPEVDEQEKVTGAKLKAHLYKCCDILRGPVPRGLYKSYVIPIVFFKRISDVYDEEYDEVYKSFDGNEDLIALHKFSFTIPDGCHWRDLRKVTTDVGTYFNNAYIKIESANPTTLGGVFSGFDDAHWTDKNIIDDNRMINLVEHVSKMKMGNKAYSADVMGDTYEYLLKEFATLEKQNGGQFYTPRTIVKLMVRILNPQKGESIYEIIMVILVQYTRQIAA